MPFPTELPSTGNGAIPQKSIEPILYLQYSMVPATVESTTMCRNSLSPGRIYCPFPQGSPRALLQGMPNTNRTLYRWNHSSCRPQCYANIFYEKISAWHSSFSPLEHFSSPGLQIALPWAWVLAGVVPLQ